MPLLICHRLPLIILLLVAAFHGDASGATYESSMCLSEPLTCGGVSFSYPFYLSSERQELNGYQNSSCGYPGMGIICDDDKPILQLDGVRNYTVKSIDGAKVSLADPEVLDNSCPRVDHNVTFAERSWLAFPASTVDYLFLFLSCFFRQGLVRPTPLLDITCQEFVTGVPGPSFVLPSVSVPPGNWSRACGLVIQAPVLKYDPVNPNNDTWRNTGYGDVLRQGFQVSWENGRPDECTQCEGSNGRCGYKQTGEFLGCLCTDGQIVDRNCTTSNSTGSKKKPGTIIAGPSSKTDKDQIACQRVHR